MSTGGINHSMGACLLFLTVLFSTHLSWSQEIGPVAIKDSRAYQEAAQVAQQEGKLWRAKALYERARLIDEDNTVILNDLGFVDEALGLDKEAEVLYLRAIEIDYKFLPAYTNLGNLYRRQGENEKAMYYLERRAQYGSPADKWTLEAQDSLGSVKQKSAATSREMLQMDKEILNNSMTLRYKELERTNAAQVLKKAEDDYQHGLIAFKAHEYLAAADLFAACLKENPLHPLAAHMLSRTKSLVSATIPASGSGNNTMQALGK